MYDYEEQTCGHHSVPSKCCYQILSIISFSCSND